MTDCARKCWIFAALMGLVVWLMAMGHGGAGVFGGLFLAFVTAWLLGGLLVLLFCGSEVEAYEPEPLRVAEPLSEADLAEGMAHLVAVCPVWARVAPDLGALPLRRRPDVAWTKTESDISRLIGLQKRLFDKAAALVRGPETDHILALAGVER